MTKSKVAVVGGGIGKLHLDGYRTLPDQFEVLAICDLNLDKARNLAAEYNIPRVTTNIADLYEMGDVDLIDICTPPSLHYEQILATLAAGKHVICEKPIAGSLKQVDELITAEAASGKRVMPIFQYRFGHGLQKLKYLRDQGLTGRAYLTTAETAWRRRADYYAVPWRGQWATELGGVLVSHAIHIHDSVTYILGPVKSLSAYLSTFVNPIEVEDTAAISLQMADGSLATFSVTIGSSAEVSRQRFCFSNLSAESNAKPYTFTSEPWTFTADTPQLNEQITEALSRFQPLPEGMAGQFYRFAQAMDSGGELPVTLADARSALEVITAIYVSAQTNQRVELPLSNAHPFYAGWQP